MAMAVAASEAVLAVAGFESRLKWPNDLVWPGDGGGADRKLAGILAESDAAAVVVGIGINVNWPHDLPPDLADVAVACNHVTGQPVDREALLVALLERLVDVYGPLVATLDRAPLLERWRARSATLGRRVRADLGAEQVVGMAVDVTADGHLVIEDGCGVRRTVVTGDVVHLRPG
jgi:BirA family biotin operon repressor/biotin-[acetyl-CoA-carboxylase] ligase